MSSEATRSQPGPDRGIELPPGPRLPAVAQTFSFARDPMGFFHRAQRRWGKAVTLKLLGFGETVWLTDPDLVRDLFSAPEEMRAGEAANIAIALFGPASMVTLDSEEHLERRRLVKPALHGDAIAGCDERASRYMRREIHSWKPRTTVAMLPAVHAVTTNLIVDVVFGPDDDARRDEIGGAMDALAAMGTLAATAPWVRHDVGPLTPWRPFLRRLHRVDRIVEAEIAAARDLDTPPSQSVLGMLVSSRHENGVPLRDAEIRDEVVGLVLAGQETTSAALAWMIDLVSRHPDVHGRLVAEAASGGAAYADAVIKESLRLRPPAIAAARIVQRDWSFGEWTVPAGTRLWAAAPLIQRREDLWERPNEFRPERFLDSKAAPFTWLPFGGGVRRCVGSALAEVTMRAVLHTLASEALLEPLGPAPERSRLKNVVMVPRQGMRLRFVGPVAVPPLHERRTVRLADLAGSLLHHSQWVGSPRAVAALSSGALDRSPPGKFRESFVEALERGLTRGLGESEAVESAALDVVLSAFFGVTDVRLRDRLASGLIDLLPAIETGSGPADLRSFGELLDRQIEIHSIAERQDVLGQLLGSEALAGDDPDETRSAVLLLLVESAAEAAAVAAGDSSDLDLATLPVSEADLAGTHMPARAAGDRSPF